MFELPPEKKWQLYLSKKKVSNAGLEENTLNESFFETCWYYAQHIVRTYVYTILIQPMLRINGCHVWWSSCGKLQNYALLITYTYAKVNLPFETYVFDS